MCRKVTVATLDSSKRKAKNAKYHEFLLLKNNNSLFCFVEGKHDDDYYLDKVRNHYGEDYVFIKCGNKELVLETYNLISKNLSCSKCHTAYFVDRDFDESLENPDIFETDRYSIENYYCSIDAFKRILQYDFKISPEKEEGYEAAVELYESESRIFHNTVSLFNAFYSLLHRYEREHAVKFQLNLGENFPSDLATIRIPGSVSSYCLRDLENKYPATAGLFTEEEVETERLRLLDNDPFRVFRGKYELEFLHKILDYLSQNANKGKEEDKIIKVRVNSNLNGKQLMSNYSRCADIPETLKAYISRFKA